MSISPIRLATGDVNMPSVSQIKSSVGWSAALSLEFKNISGKTVLGNTQRKGPLVVQRAFYPEGDVCHIYLVHPPGGVVGGDVLEIKAELGRETSTLVTTPGATKFYRSAGPISHQQQTLLVGDNACLEWLPQENIFFPGARVRSNTQVFLSLSSRLAIWDIQCLGRPSISDMFTSGLVDSSVSIFRGDKPVTIERLRVNKENMERVSLLRSHPVAASFMIVGADEQHLKTTRDLLARSEQNVEAAVTLIQDCLIIRSLGDSTNTVQKLFREIWSLLRPCIFSRAAILPRIWNT